MGIKRRAPLLAVDIVAPFGRLRRKQGVRALSERRQGCLAGLGGAARGDWIDAGRDKLASFGCFGAGFCQRELRDAYQGW